MRRKQNFKSWTKETSALGHAAKAAKRMAGPVPEYRVAAAGELVGVLSWQGVDGEVRRWVVKRGKRLNGLQVVAKGKRVECGWARLFASLRKRLVKGGGAV